MKVHAPVTIARKLHSLKVAARRQGPRSAAATGLQNYQAKLQQAGLRLSTIAYVLNISNCFCQRFTSSR